MLKRLDNELEIRKRGSSFGLHPHQLSLDRDFERMM